MEVPVITKETEHITDSHKNATSMKAAVVPKWGDASVMQVIDYPIPTIKKPNQVLVRIHASGVNPVDDMLRKGNLKLLYSLRTPYVPQMDGAGVVVEVGKKVVNFKIGDNVYGYIHPKICGCAAQYCLFKESDLALKPKILSFPEAASIPGIPFFNISNHIQVVGITAFVGINKMELKSGNRLLILGAAGGVGSMGIQYAKVLGAHVIAVCSGKKVEYVKSLGADEIIDYTSQKLSEVLSKEEDKVDFVFDTVGDKELLNQSYKVLKSSGRVISCAYFNPLSILAGKVGIHQPLSPYLITPDAEALTKLAKLFDEGKLKSPQINTHTLDEIVEAHKKVMSKGFTGKVVVVVS